MAIRGRVDDWETWAVDRRWTVAVRDTMDDLDTSQWNGVDRGWV